MSWHTISPYHTTWLITKKTLQCLQFFYAPWRDITAIPREASRTVIEVLQKVLFWLLSQLLRIFTLAQELDSGPSSQQYRSTCIKCLRVLVRHRDMLPSSFFCRNVRRVGTHPVSGGGFADIWKGSIAGKTVCVKVLRFFSANATGQNLVKVTLKDCFQEAVVWKQLKHPNVLPFLGVNQDLFAPSFCLISPWMENGNIIYFLSKHPTHNRLQCLLEIAEGLKYLHELDPQITHADVRGVRSAHFPFLISGLITPRPISL
ncbi:hypothetical protein BDZ89DRAFT_956290 [Hymenopellis radicata]|nr:hypothetical protein BDZ89DRAFT_956290 [Hymenopellis radicata]